MSSALQLRKKSTSMAGSAGMSVSARLFSAAAKAFSYKTTNRVVRNAEVHRSVTLSGCSSRTCACRKNKGNPVGPQYKVRKNRPPFASRALPRPLLGWLRCETPYACQYVHPALWWPCSCTNLHQNGPALNYAQKHEKTRDMSTLVLCPAPIPLVTAANRPCGVGTVQHTTATSVQPSSTRHCIEHETCEVLLRFSRGTTVLLTHLLGRN